MEFKMFQEMLAEDVQSLAGEEFEVSLRQVEKLNGVSRTALCLSRREDTLAPTIYLEEFFEQYQEGVSLSHLSELVLGQYEGMGERVMQIPADFFSDYEKAKDHIYCQLIHAKRNQELLRQAPHRMFLDLAVVYYFEVQETFLPDATILIHENHREHWGISPEELEETAWANTLRDLKPKCVSILDILRGEREELPTEEPLRKAMGLYLLGNTRGRLGAVCIRYPGLLKELSERFDADLYILPSSIHECLILPDRKTCTREELEHMVREVNATEVAVTEVLSDRVYCYRRSIGGIVM